MPTKLIPYEKPIVEFVDALLMFARKNGSEVSITKDKDWDTMAFMYRGWSTLYPKSAKEFEDEMKSLRAHQKVSHAIAKEGSAVIQHKLKIPRPLYDMILTIWPFQTFNDKFVNKFAELFPMLKVTSDKL